MMDPGQRHAGMTAWVGVLVLVGCVTVCRADFGSGTNGVSPNGVSPNVVQPNDVAPNDVLSLDPQRYSVLGGVELLRMGGEDQVLPALAVRYRLESPWLTALEIGGALPTDVSSGFHQNSFTNEYTTPVTMDHAQIDSISEAHVAGVWEFWRMPLFIPELSLGVSVGRFGNQATTTTAFVTQVDNTQTTVSQIIQLGGTVPITQTVAFHADLGYVRYYNHIQPTDEHTLDLFVSAVTFRALIAVRL